MITTLLWRCPFCHTDDRMRASRPLFGPGRVTCRACGTRWQVRRVPGQDYRLQVVAGAPELLGSDLPLAQWYARIKADVRLVPRPLPLPGSLEGEEAYTSDEDVLLIARRDVPLPPLGKDRTAPALKPSNGGKGGWIDIGYGRLSLTNRRLLWDTPRGGYDFWWPEVRSVSSFLTAHLIVAYGDVAYRFRPPADHLLKWLTYSGRVAERLRETTGQELPVSYH